MPSIKQIALIVGGTIAVSIVGAIVAFLNEMHLEVSFDKLKNFKATDVASYADLIRAIKVELEIASDQDFVAYWVDDDSGKPIVRKSDISYKNFRLNNRIAGRLTDQDDRASYSITGYYNDKRIVFSHRGPISGTGVYILDLIPITGVITPTYAGYEIIEDTVRPGSTQSRLLQCPVVMVAETTAAKAYPSEEVARKAFPILNSACSEFKMFSNAVTEQAK